MIPFLHQRHVIDQRFASGQLSLSIPSISFRGTPMSNTWTSPVYSSAPGANNPGYVKHGEHVNTHGDRADFDWVSDQRIIESTNLILEALT